MWTFDQSSGKLYHNQDYVADGYSGHELGKNNPKMEAARGVGPIPRGIWAIGKPRLSKQVGPVAIPLTPLADTNTFHRSAFFIHGDSIKNPGQASHGCIIMPRVVREEIWASDDHVLTVVE